MAKSRFTNTMIFRNASMEEPRHYATWDLPTIMKGYGAVDLLRNQNAYTHVWQSGDRMDKLASKYLGDDNYGWIICLVNMINNPFSVQPGTVLRIPANAQSILEQLGM